ncbi:MAG: ubiquinol-cytochrome c reductase iron-sulfur subunit [Proteobacteria bacterium]|nr:ubiquinol-cytochrome c reductase iron-sulfur subunit [Pseudomonadota bacterium]
MSDHELAAKWEAPQVSKRVFLRNATGLVATVGAAAALWPFIDSMNPSADVIAASKVYVDLRGLKPGIRNTARWRSRPIFISHRTPDEIAAAQKVDLAVLRYPQPDSARVRRDEWLVVVGICTFHGCLLSGQEPASLRGRWDGWFCPCCASHYDTSGRVRIGPAKRNLDIPPYEITGDGILEIG